MVYSFLKKFGKQTHSSYADPLPSRFVSMSEGDFFLFCQAMNDYRIERVADGTILIMEAAGSETGSFK